MAVSQYLSDARDKWVSAVKSVVGSSPHSASWTGHSAIATALQPFASAVNHAHFATGGGMDMDTVSLAPEAGCIEIGTSGAVYLFKPKALHLEVIPGAIAESFLLIELDRLKPTGVYEGVYNSAGFESEELLDLGSANYVSRSHADRGYYGTDDDGNERPLPNTARIVIRVLNGSILIVSKGTAWNASSGTYDGRHAKMNVSDIRTTIENALRTGREIV